MGETGKKDTTKGGEDPGVDLLPVALDVECATSSDTGVQKFDGQVRGGCGACGFDVAVDARRVGSTPRSGMH